jgi:hypothetical protein
MSITTTAMSPYSWRGVLDTTLCDEVYVYENWTKAEVHRTLFPILHRILYILRHCINIVFILQKKISVINGR